MRTEHIKKGTKVKVVTIDDDLSFQADERHIRARQLNVTGVVVKSYNRNNFAGLWQVKHDGTGVIAVYVYYELQPA